MEVIRGGRVDFTLLLTRYFTLAAITQAYSLFSAQEDGVLKAAIKP